MHRLASPCRMIARHSFVLGNAHRATRPPNRCGSGKLSGAEARKAAIARTARGTGVAPTLQQGRNWREQMGNQTQDNKNTNASPQQNDDQQQRGGQGDQNRQAGQQQDGSKSNQSGNDAGSGKQSPGRGSENQGR